MVIDLLSEHFPQIVDAEFTAGMEDNLDKISEGKVDWTKSMAEFWDPFSKRVKEKESLIEKVNTAVELDEKCPDCGKILLIRTGRFGKFKACSGFPECRYTEQIVEDLGVNCPACGQSLSARRTKRGKTFFGCTGYPKCSFALWQLTPAALAKKIKDAPGEYPHLKETEASLVAKAKIKEER